MYSPGKPATMFSSFRFHFVDSCWDSFCPSSSFFSFLFVSFLIFKILLYNFSLSPPWQSPPPDIHVISRNYLLSVLTNLLAAFKKKRQPLLSDQIFVSTGRLWDVYDSKLFWRLRTQKVEENLWYTYQPLPIRLSVYRPYMKYTAPMCGPVSL